MKHLILIAILALSLPVAARPVKLAWDVPIDSPTSWKVLRGGVVIGSTLTIGTTVEANTGDSITVIAVSEAGIYSLPSLPVIVPSLVTIPPPMDMIQRSSDLDTWVDVAPIPHTDSQFIRIRITAP